MGDGLCMCSIQFYTVSICSVGLLVIRDVNCWCDVTRGSALMTCNLTSEKMTLDSNWTQATRDMMTRTTSPCSFSVFLFFFFFVLSVFPSVQRWYECIFFFFKISYKISYMFLYILLDLFYWILGILGHTWALFGQVMNLLIIFFIRLQILIHCLFYYKNQILQVAGGGT